MIFYGDEFAKPNDDQFQRDQEALTGYQDARYRVRGAVDWPAVDQALATPGSLPAHIHGAVRAMLAVRRSQPALSGGSFQPVPGLADSVLGYVRSSGDSQVLVLQNLGDTAVDIALPADLASMHWHTVYGEHKLARGALTLSSKGFGWFAA
ncbi:MAG: DUF3459 domain-containing protein [Burkholderiales bacterium]|nr:DUF3459 domain-containing protein [Burkholderiales bacterium]